MSHLYLHHFGLAKPPFQITPDLEFFFSGGRRGDILNAMLHVAHHDEGITMLVAEVGSGKTLLARLLINRLGEDVCTVYLANPCFSRDEIISAICRDLGLSQTSHSTEEKLAALNQELLRRHSLGQRVLLVVDEAHLMPAESLEEIRLLSNLETGQHKLINIFLFGQPELDSLIGDPKLRQVRDRVVHRFELGPLPRDEVDAYLDHRLREAGWNGGVLFSPAARKKLFKASEGRARRINLLADKALLAAFAQASRSIKVSQIESAVNELQGGLRSKNHGLSKAQHTWLVCGASIAIAFGALWLLDKQSSYLRAIAGTPHARLSMPKESDSPSTEHVSGIATSSDIGAKSSIEQDKEALLSNSKTNLFSSWSQVTKIVAAVDRMNVERHGFKRNAPRKFSALAIGQSLGESSALLRIFGLGKQALARGTGHTQKEQSL
ncbi:MAG: AAA family ATPase [Rhodoferax sp.]|jgi:type II secretory pathway predicted ATPase ExeA|nr:AAA family ATPase [Rhodoferax sp.]MBP6492679.1 AAA family ATPase [Rhodoferax sp.]MBP7572397.1 AAA family ATPase [Rhodoferax sp.]HPW06894.1 AAA family ATPase [Burkholderiaceae bacterium]